MLNNHVEIWKQSVCEDAEELEPECKDKSVTVLKLTESLGLTETDI
jgi:hypothetical protein